MPGAKPSENRQAQGGASPLGLGPSSYPLCHPCTKTGAGPTHLDCLHFTLPVYKARIILGPVQYRVSFPQKKVWPLPLVPMRSPLSPWRVFVSVFTWGGLTSSQIVCADSVVWDGGLRPCCISFTSWGAADKGQPRGWSVRSMWSTPSEPSGPQSSGEHPQVVSTVEQEPGHSGLISPGHCPGCLIPLLTFICVLSLGWTVIVGV